MGLTRIKNYLPMDAIDLLWHLLGFSAPAAAMALAMTLIGRWLPGGQAPPFWRRLATHFGLGLAVLLTGLVPGGADGRMLTYAALVLVLATAELGLSARRG